MFECEYFFKYVLPQIIQGLFIIFGAIIGGVFVLLVGYWQIKRPLHKLHNSIEKDFSQNKIILSQNERILNMWINSGQEKIPHTQNVANNTNH